jgi:L-fuculokinase
MYPQYWAWRLCGAAASEATSLGCHTDLWHPVAPAVFVAGRAHGLEA